jgi:hypothetical protein
LVKKYVVRLSGEERERLETLIQKGKSPARRVLKARILLKADVSEGGKGWSDNRIIETLETSPSMVHRTRKQLVEAGFEAVLSRKPCAMLAIARIFDGEKEAKLIALACSKPPKGRARWTLRLLENKVRRNGHRRSWSSASNGTTLQFPTNKPSSGKSPPRSTTAMPTTPRPTGNSPPIQDGSSGNLRGGWGGMPERPPPLFASNSVPSTHMRCMITAN